MLQMMQSLQKGIKTKRVFISYSHRDEQLKDLLLLTIRSLEAEGYIRTWHDRMRFAGQELDDTIRKNLETADLVLFLVTDSFLKSGYCRNIEMKIAMRMSKQKEAYVIPLILSECDWKRERFAKLLALPTDGRPLFKANGVPYPQRLQQILDGLRLALLGLWNYSKDDGTFGATIGALSSPVGESEPVDGHPEVELLEPSRSFTPFLLKRLKVGEGAEQLNFLMDTGQSDIAVQSPEFESEHRRVMDYFWESLCVEEEQQWVNLSPYDSSRMLPEALSGTRLGHDMLAFDYKLKAFSASLLHPDSTSGREYWRELYQRARSTFGTTLLPFQSFQTVTVSASKAKVFVPKRSWVPSNRQIRDFLSGPYLGAAIVVAAKLQAVCNSDRKAEQLSAEGPLVNKKKVHRELHSANDVATAVFRELILPLIEREVNEGETFAFNRQLFFSMILAAWFKKLAKKDKSVAAKFAGHINKNRPSNKIFTSLRVTQLTDSGPIASRAISEKRIGTLPADDPAFRVPENVHFYKQYLRLFSRGLYRVVRTEMSDSPGQMTGRVYFSGAVDLSAIRVSTAHSYQ